MINAKTIITARIEIVLSSLPFERRCMYFVSVFGECEQLITGA